MYFRVDKMEMIICLLLGKAFAPSHYLCQLGRSCCVRTCDNSCIQQFTFSSV